jgi:uncharacterized membrane protein
MLLIIGVYTPLVMKYIPNRNEPFMALAILGKDGMAKNYYPENNSDLEKNEKLIWNIFLYNHMGKSQYISLKVKITNSTTSPPNSTICEPSHAPTTYEILRVIQDNETLVSPLSWMIKNSSKKDEFVKLEKISFNNEIVEVDAVSKKGYNFRIIVELWIYNKESKEFQFGWKYGEETRCAWNQIWFNSTSPN